jgi:hypothetical protein
MCEQVKSGFEHAADCELITVPTYGLCTCDFDKRMAQWIEGRRRDARLGRARKYTPEMILELQDALMADRQNSMVIGGRRYEDAKMQTRIAFDAWENDAMQRHTQ